MAKPTDPKREGYTFVDWYTDKATTQAYDFATPVTANITLYAKWTAVVETFTVSFNSNGGSAVEPRTVNKDAKVDKPTDPEKEGYTFEGWYTDADTTQAYDFTTATVTANMTLYAKWEVKLVSIPDVNFRTYLKENISVAFEGELMDRTHSSVLGLTSLDVDGKSISSLAGIEYFTALTSLSCSDNSLTELDVTKNTALTELDCGDNSLTILDVRQNTALTLLYCYNNSLTVLDVTQNTALTQLYCYDNSLTVLDVRQNTALNTLSCNHNSLTALDVTQNTALAFLFCQGNQLSSLDLKGRRSFSFLRIDAGTATNPLEQLYVHTDLQTHAEIQEAKTNREAAITISTYNDANERVCRDFNPNEGDAGTCKD